jgi:transcriptional antiterminator RfaH
MSCPALNVGQRWYVAFTQPSAEMRAVAHLRNQGFTTYLPRFMKKRRSARRVEVLLKPLFPRYVFVGLDLQRERWRSVNGTVGVARLVCQGEWPAPLDDRVLQAISDREDEDGLVRLAPAAFRPGQAVRIVDGVFAEQLGFYEGLADHERVRILLTLLGRKVKVSIENEAVVAA